MFLRDILVSKAARARANDVALVLDLSPRVVIEFCVYHSATLPVPMEKISSLSDRVPFLKSMIMTNECANNLRQRAERRDSTVENFTSYCIEQGTKLLVEHLKKPASIRLLRDMFAVLKNAVNDPMHLLDRAVIV